MKKLIKKIKGIPKRFKEIVHIMMFRHNPLSVEIMSANICFLWGVWLLFPGDIFAISNSYNAMAVLAPDYVWGVCMTLLGIAQWVFIFDDHLKGREVVMLLGGLAWLFIAGTFLASGTGTTAIITYGIIGTATMWASFRLAMINSQIKNINK